MSLSDKLKKAGVTTKKSRTEPLWKGPEKDGITFSLLSRFLACRERFRLYVIEGLKPAPTFNHRIEYGQMWHVCEEALASEHKHFGEMVGTTLWSDNLKNYSAYLCKEHPTQQEQINHWYNVCRVQFPLYIRDWSKHPDVTERTPLLQEQVFDVSYQLPSGRTVRLRGKWDSVDLVQGKCRMCDGKRTVGYVREVQVDRDPPTRHDRCTGCNGSGKDGGVIWLQENKTKGDIKEVQLQRQLKFDLQSMIYLVALTQDTGIDSLEEKKQEIGTGKTPSARSSSSIKGIRYNVVRRPLSGGKGSIVRHKATKNHPEETKEHYYGTRLKEVIEEDPGYFFMRWKIDVSPADVLRFRRECLDPILENLVHWYNEVTGNSPTHPDDMPYIPMNWRHPFGVHNPMDEGGASDLDGYLETGSDVGLRRVDTLFSELE